ncbi:alpha/beta hydrolase [Methylophaga muralis]|uniref:Alpha/beta hydrolase family protein n=1 Tax=Methylophaga muralis TaxID=291169 RepID=A0A1E3GTJ1_9GAMM|nr:alpha/beta hydrolase [Methylophaga muralis]ODN67370.1 Alpha/beta hydrolase family protein [Methylophaga muralis]
MVVVMTGCADISLTKRNDIADNLAFQHGWQKSTLQTTFFSHRAYLPNSTQSDQLTVYIEGDGLAWISRNKPSSDPTPLNPLALKLALADGINNVAYLARPCQYVNSNQCEQRYWTSARFAEEVIASTDQALSQLKKQTGAQELTLIGYSGGGAVAALVAARRNDVVKLITVAGNLDHKAWSDIRHISALTGSLNAADEWQNLADISQIHFVGAQDNIVPLAVAQSYQRRFTTGYKPEVKVIEATDHHCCWLELWPDLLESKY